MLFLCTGNSCRSQMAEGWARHLYGDILEVYSAGIEVHGLNPRAVKVMSEAGIDISGHQSKHLGTFCDVEFDLVITVCDHARESCPLYLNDAIRIHSSFDDPPALSENAADEEERLEIYRRVRDEIRYYVTLLPEHSSVKALFSS